MKIVHVNYSDKIGGAAIAAYRLHKESLQQNIDSYLYVRKKVTNDRLIITPNKLSEIRNKIEIKIEIFFYNLLRMENSSFPTSFIPERNYKALETLNPDIVNLHWINGGFISLNNVHKINSKIVWTLHDMWLFNSIAHYSDNYLIKNVKFLNGATLKFKKKCIDKIKNLIIITPSKWLAQCASNSYVLKNQDIRVIPNGVDINIFRPHDKLESRKTFNIGEDKKVILFGSFNSENSKRKGIDLIKDSLLKLYNNNYSREELEVVVFGSKDIRTNNDFGYKTRYIGSLFNESKLASLYSAADIFALPSRIDNLPNTGIESLACGTPVIAFDVGGLQEIIDHKINGYLAEPFSTDDLVGGINYILEQSLENSFCEQCRAKAIKNFDLKNMVKSYNDIYKELFSKR